MRYVLGLITLLLTVSASAEVVAGRRFVLIDVAWAPVGGGPVTPLGVSPESAAFDGERFLTVWRDGERLRFALFEEGAAAPVTETSIDAPGVDAPFVRWDGTRYVLAAGGHPGMLAIVSAGGIVESTATLDATQGLVDLAASSSGIALLLHYATASHNGVVDVVFLDSGLRPAIRSTVGSIVRSNGFGTTWIGTPKLAPFGARFYAIWREARSGRYDTLFGTVVELNGSAATGTRLESVFAYPWQADVFVHPYESRLAVIAVRPGGNGVTITIIEPDGRPTTLSAWFKTDGLPEVSTVHLMDGSIVAIYVKDGVATVIQLLRPPALPGRRRSARH